MGWTWNNVKAEEVLAGYTKADSPLVCAQTSAGAWGEGAVYVLTCSRCAPPPNKKEHSHWLIGGPAGGEESQECPLGVLARAEGAVGWADLQDSLLHTGLSS